MLIFGMGLYGLFISNVPPDVPPSADRAIKSSALFGMFAMKVTFINLKRKLFFVPSPGMWCQQLHQCTPFVYKKLSFTGFEDKGKEKWRQYCIKSCYYLVYTCFAHFT